LKFLSMRSLQKQSI